MDARRRQGLWGGTAELRSVGGHHASSVWVGRGEGYSICTVFVLYLLCRLLSAVLCCMPEVLKTYILRYRVMSAA